MALPRRRFETGEDDIQTIDQDVESLAAKYLTPIDNIRSYSSPGPVFSGRASEPFQGMETSSTRPLESRAHAFLRFIGFPVATEEGFYNPGFDPIENTQFLGELTGIARKRQAVNEKFAQAAFRRLVTAREEDPQFAREIFSREDLNSSLYALLLTNLIRPFDTIQDGVGPFEIDEQSFSVASRQFFVDDFFNNNENLNRSDVNSLVEVIGANFTEGTHVLKPFVVDPRIDITVMPDTSRVAVPFLPDANSLRLDQNKSVLRPGIELIIAERLLGSSTEDSVYLEALEKLANDSIGPSDLIIGENVSAINTRELRSSAEAILDDNEINDAGILDLQGITTVQVKNIRELVRLLKGLVAVLKESLEVVSRVSRTINWVPVPNPEGPELGRRGSRLAIANTSNILTKIDKRINQLKLQKFAATSARSGGANAIGTETVGLGGFASPFSTNSVYATFASPFATGSNAEDVAKIDEELNTLVQRRNKLADIGFQAMGRIELIMGEVSGLGLIDVISVYIALWAMDETSLVSLLDDISFDRLVNNFPDLVVGAAADRRDAGTRDTITVALENFENKLRNVLTFVEREFARQSLAPGEEEGGQISPDN